jgi:hypothetical protein
MAPSIESIINKIVSSRVLKIVTCAGFFLTPQLLLIVIGIYDQAAHAQSLVGSPYGPIYDYAGPLTDFGYDIVREISCVVTALSAVLSSIVGLKIARRNGGKSAMNIAKGFGIALGVPLAVYLIGTFNVSSYGGLRLLYVLLPNYLIIGTLLMALIWPKFSVIAKTKTSVVKHLLIEAILLFGVPFAIFAIDVVIDSILIVPDFFSRYRTDSALNYVHVITGLTALICLAINLWFVVKMKKGVMKSRYLLIGAVILFGVPFIAYVNGISIVDYLYCR